MNTSLLKATLSMLACVLLARPAPAEDHCELHANRDLTGPATTLALPSVAATLLTGAPRDSAWANTSRRFSASDLAALDNQISAARIRALDSDVALYLLDGGDLNGRGNVFFCKQGFFCTLELGSDMNDRASSAICQREFFRKAMLRDPDSDPTRAYFAALLNPIFDLRLVSTAVDEAARSAFAGADGVDAYRATRSEDGWSLWSRTTWITGYDYCKRFNAPCQHDPNEKYEDLFRISKRFEIDVNGFWADSIPFLDDDYVVQADWYVRPVIDDGGGNPAAGELRFWWARTEVWIEEGRLADAIASNAERTIFDFDIQQGLRDLFVLGAAYAGCPHCIDGKNRLQFSVYPSEGPTRSVWLEPFEMDVTEPKLILNDSRDATYDDGWE